MSLQAIADGIMKESDNDINNVKSAYAKYGNPETNVSYISCNCMEDWCRSPFSHGIRFDGKSIKELNKEQLNEL